jgi:hypothetical protein
MRRPPKGSKGLWQNGNTPHPSTAPRLGNHLSLARYIAYQTNSGQELVDKLLLIMREGGSPNLQFAATLALLDRQLGKPLQLIEHEIPQPKINLDLRHLPVEKLRLIEQTLRGALDKAQTEKQAQSEQSTESTVIDIPDEESTDK